MALYAFLVYTLSYIGLFLLSFYLLSFSQSRKSSIPEKAQNLSVSVLIPAYNEGASIVRTLTSAYALDYPRDKLEIIVVDDGSRDQTLALAQAFARTHSGVRVFHQVNGGKANALNTALRYAKGDVVVSMDADSFAAPDALQRMVARFYSSSVMAVTSSISILHPRTVWQRIQAIEYYLTVFVRRALSFTNSIYITSGAFSAYRRSFFIDHRGYAEGTITEDLEIALRIQSNGYRIEYAPQAHVTTVGPSSFKELLYQRRRWYTGLVRNLWAYRSKLFGVRKGILGTLVLPCVVISTALSIALTAYAITKAFSVVSNELHLLSSVNFEFMNAYELNLYVIETILLTLLSSPLLVFILFFVIVSFFYLLYARRTLSLRHGFLFNYLIFIAFYGILFSFWWIVSLLYLGFNKKVPWRKS